MNHVKSNAKWSQTTFIFSMMLTVLFFIITLIYFMKQTAVVHAASFIVNNTADAVDSNVGDGDCDIDNPPSNVCTLRAALEEANATPGIDEITIVSGTYGLNRIGTDDTAFNGDLDITEDVIIRGEGANITIIDGGALDRVFHITGTVSVTISGVTIRNGAAAEGAGIANHSGNLTVISATISGNQASGVGGGIYNDGDLILQNSTVSTNTAVFTGGGMQQVTGTVLITNSTFSGNSANIGGGAVSHHEGATLFTNVTINNNASPSGAGISRVAGTVTLKNSIISNNIAGSDCMGTIVSNGNNLDSDNSCNLTDGTDIPGTNPALEPLQDNGGPTLTHALQVGSPAINEADDSVCPIYDQRGEPRYAACDIGAFEIEIYRLYAPFITSEIESDSGGIGNSCNKKVPLFTADSAPTDGTLEFHVLYGEFARKEGISLHVWDVSAGQQINNEEVTVRAPKWVRIWWQPDGDANWYLLPSQYWSGDGTVLSEYGVSCSDANVPSYHTSFANAIPESDVPIFTLPLLFEQ